MSKPASELTTRDLASLNLRGEITAVISFAGGWLVFTADETHYLKPKQVGWLERRWHAIEAWMRGRLGGAA